ncbi:hypothetical protein HDV05_001309 [Chytridiales sp. JEL 0842]|nr:hypothetical protein HDV05_001309 [Chytridiales sp. JEL 0842]
MDATAVSRKMFIAQLFQCSVTPESSLFRFASFEFKNVWLQGYIVEVVTPTRFYLDDGSVNGLVRIDVDPTVQLESWQPGDVVATIGAVAWDPEEGMMSVSSATVLNKNNDPDAMTYWMMEVPHIHQEVYLPTHEEVFGL